MARKGNRRDACTFLVGKPERYRKLGKSTHIWEDNNIIMDVSDQVG
jgi:hypothetical protein